MKIRAFSNVIDTNIISFAWDNSNRFKIKYCGTFFQFDHIVCCMHAKANGMDRRSIKNLVSHAKSGNVDFQLELKKIFE